MRLLALAALSLAACGAPLALDGQWRGLWYLDTADVAARDQGIVDVTIDDGHLIGSGPSTTRGGTLALDGVLHDDNTAALTFTLDAGTYQTAGTLRHVEGSRSTDPDHLTGTMNLYVGTELRGTARLDVARQ